MVRIASRHLTTMPRLLPAILLSAGLQSALAAAPATAAAVPATAARSEAIVQAQLLVPTDPAPSMGRGDTAAAAKGRTKAEVHGEEDRGVGGMLLAALALMTGIAVRRWGMGQQ
jgi:hypothetical protein